MGGKAFKHITVNTIERNEVPILLEYIDSLLDIPSTDVHLVGSAGKAPKSNDIDIVIDTNKYSAEVISERLLHKLGPENCSYNRGFNVGSYIIRPKNKLVQMDLMFTPHVDWAKFSYYCPDSNTTHFKGSVRTALLASVTTNINVTGLDHFTFNSDGLLVIRAGRTFDLNLGIRRIFQYRPYKDGRYASTMKTINANEFAEKFPHVRIGHYVMPITDPDHALSVIFDQPVHPSDVQTAEQVFELIKTSFNGAVQHKILHTTMRKVDIKELLV